jgi:hypothetical protein
LADKDWQFQGGIRKPDTHPNPNTNANSNPNADANRYANTDSCTSVQPGRYSSIIESNQPFVDGQFQQRDRV